MRSRHNCSNILKNTVEIDNGCRLTGYRIKQYIEDGFNVSYHPNAIYKLSKNLDFSWITSRSRHPKQSEQVQQGFKKTANGIDQNDPAIYQSE
ncbi:helix-turn-helix domain-containing protein [Pseudoalteromonas piscicida]|uniref:helix-turn-helix domain-containing protein n=1 Tax=Pseudoalteromonas piscicida TaxID=43662 RepID=UPI003CC91453